MFPPVFQTLVNDSELSGLFEGRPRVYRHGNAPQGAQRPYITWSATSIAPENTLSETPGIDRATVQVDVWCEQDALTVDIAKAVRDAIEPYAHLISQPFDGWDLESKTYRMTLQFDWFVPRE
jgi:hypothetical protein